ncbi:4517_t:CDS:2, partial [Gigaspora margarita]
MSSQKILDTYNQSLSNIICNQEINHDVIIYTRKIYELEDQRAIITDQTRNYFQAAKINDHINRKDNIYIDWEKNIDRNNVCINLKNIQTINDNETSEILFNSEISVYTNDTDKNVNCHENRRQSEDAIESSDLDVDNLDEINSFFQSSSSRQESGNDFLQKLQKSNVSNNQGKEEKPLLLSSNRKYFNEFYTEMDKSKKWTLSSGTCVEDILFRRGNSLSTESLIHSWIIDLNDLETKRLFTDEDWREISKTVHKQPTIDKNIHETADLRKVLDTTSYKDKNELFEQEKHFDAVWIEH